MARIRHKTLSEIALKNLLRKTPRMMTQVKRTFYLLFFFLNHDITKIPPLNDVMVFFAESI